jgi:RHS repeat-associated protein
VEGVSNYSLAMTYTPSGNILTAKVKGVPQEPGLPTSNRDVKYMYDVFDPQAVHRLEDNVTGQDLAYMTYDAAGEMTSRSWPIGQDLQMLWDGDGQLVESKTPGGDIERYHYDEAGQRAWMRAFQGAETGTRYWFGNSELFVPTTGTTGKKRYLYIGDSGGTLARLESVDGAPPTSELFYSDALQSLMLTTSTSGPLSAPVVNVSSWFHYGAFGEVIAQAGHDSHKRAFNGKESDRSTGLRYYGARYYDSLLMRWNSSDPLYRFVPEIDLANPQRQNLYAFTANNPIGLVDPDGRNPIALGIVVGEVLGDAILTIFGITSAAYVADSVGEVNAQANIPFIGSYADDWASMNGPDTRMPPAKSLSIDDSSEREKRGSRVQAKPLEGKAQVQGAPSGNAEPPGPGKDEDPSMKTTASGKPYPAPPKGMDMRQFEKLMNWGKNGSKVPREAIEGLNKEVLQKAGLTEKLARQWAEFYSREAARVPTNPSAPGRAELMEAAAKMLAQ